MLNTWSEEQTTVFYSYLACFVNTLTLNTYVSVPYSRAQQAEYSIRILVAAPQEYANTYSTFGTRTQVLKGITNRKQTGQKLQSRWSQTALSFALKYINTLTHAVTAGTTSRLTVTD